jgi:hypothetical protein
VVIATNSRPNEDPIAPAGDAEPVKSADAAVPVTVRDPLACEVERVEALEPAVEARVEILDNGTLDAGDVRRPVGVLEGKVWL